MSVFEPVVTAIHVLGHPVMRVLFPEHRLAKKISVSVGSEPILSVSHQQTSSYSIQIRSDFSVFDLTVTNLYTQMLANNVLITAAQPQLGPNAKEIGYLQTRSFEIPAAQISSQARDLVAALRSASPVSAIDRLDVSLSVEAVVRTGFSKDFSVVREFPLRMEVTN